MEFCLFGPLRVLDAGRDLTPARPKQRAALALLLLYRGEIVAGDRLTEALWGEAPPETARTALHGHVSALRKLLGPGRIETRPPGYVLHVAPDELDLARFEAGLAEARGEPHPEQRSARLRAALALWQGEPLADLRYEPFGQQEAARLDELRLAAIEDRIEADLALGRHHELVPELEALVAQEPFRERLRGQLMLALYRCGRQAEALHVFQNGRRRLVDELGIELSPALQGLERKILNQDASLDLEIPAAAPSPGRSAREERKVVTALFAAVGFTARAERLDPEDVGSLLGPYHSRVLGELERYGGTVEKLAGGSVIALFGAPSAHEDDPERAVRAALAVRDWARQQDDALQLHIGIDTGEALVRIGPQSDHGQATVTGAVVTGASRIQAAAPGNTVLVGEQTYRATADVIAYCTADTGAVGMLPVWEAVQARPRGAQQPLAPLVGRDRELDVLSSGFARVREERSPQLVTLVGAPGIGKTRLVRELLGAIEEEDATRRIGRSLPYGDGITFWALGEIVKAQAGILESDSAIDAAAKLRRAVQRLGTDDSEIAWLDAHLRPLAGAGTDDAAAAGDASAAWRRFLEALAEQRPLVLVFEDLHWADEALLDFVDELVERVTDVPLLVVGTARPELLDRRPGWGGGKPNAATLTLPPLADDATARLVAMLLKRPAPEDDEPLLARIGGNPLFAEQYARALIEQGGLVDLPETVHGMIAARIDALPDGEKQLLQDAAVAGKVFWVGALEAIGGHDRSAAEETLRRLERKQFTQRVRRSAISGEAEYAFRHVLLRDVAYGQLPRSSRIEKHRRAAEWIESLGRVSDHAELLAYHYQQALDFARVSGIEESPVFVARARDALRAAGQRALSLAGYVGAEAFFADALELTPETDPLRPALLLERARALFPLGKPGLELLVESLEGFQAQGDAEGTAQAAAIAARYAWFAGDRAATDRYIELALEAVADRPGSRARAEVLSHRSGFLMLDGKYEESIRVGAEALPLVEALGMEDQRARLNIVVGTARASGGDKSGIEQIEDGLAIGLEIPNYDMVDNAYANLTSEFHVYGELDNARRAWEGLAQLSDRYGLERFRRVVRAEGAGWAYLEGRWDEAVAIVDELSAAAEAGDRDYTDAIMLSLRAWIRLARGDAAGADRDSAHAVEIARASDAQAQATAFAIRPAVSLVLGDREEADAVATELVAMGPVLVSACCMAFPTLAATAWVFRDLGREAELMETVLAPNVVDTPWVGAAEAIVDGEFGHAADIIDRIGHRAAAAYARLRTADALTASGHAAEAAAERARADMFIRDASATAWLGADAT